MSEKTIRLLNASEMQEKVDAVTNRFFAILNHPQRTYLRYLLMLHRDLEDFWNDCLPVDGFREVNELLERLGTMEHELTPPTPGIFPWKAPIMPPAHARTPSREISCHRKPPERPGRTHSAWCGIYTGNN